MSKLKEIINSTKDTLEGSSIHAIPNIIRNKYSIIKFVWSICFLISFGLCCWFIVESILGFLEYDVVTSIKINYENVLKFPIVTICNLNYFATDYSYLVLKTLFNSSQPDIGLMFFAKILSNLMIKKYGLDNRKLGNRLNETIMSCNFMWQPCDMTNDFEEYFDNWYGLCFRFNSGKNMLGKSVDQKYVYQSGSLGSLDLQLFVGSAVSNDKPFSIENGYTIFITDELVNTMSREGIRIMAGSSVTLSLNKNTVKKKPKPYSDCTEDLNDINSYDSEFYRKLFSQKMKYNYLECSFLCFQKELAKECGCQTSIYDLYFYKDMRICSLPNDNMTMRDMENDNKCFYKNIARFANKPADQRDCDCPFKCDYTQYDYTISSAEYPTKQYYSNHLSKLDLIKSKFAQKNYNDVKQSVARVQIFYDDMKQTLINENEKTQLADLISSIGGTLGLFLGKLILSKNSIKL
jgi:hypothetical protein